MRGIRCEALVQPREVEQIQLGILRRDPSLKHHPTWARYREQVAIPRGLRRVRGQRTMGAMPLDECLEINEQGHSVMTAGQGGGVNVARWIHRTSSRMVSKEIALEFLGNERQLIAVVAIFAIIAASDARPRARIGICTSMGMAGGSVADWRNAR